MKRVLLIFFLLGCLGQDEPGEIHVTLILQDGVAEKEITVTLSEGASVLDLLEKATRVEYKESASGVFVESINGIRNDAEKNLWWVYYINEISASVSCDKYRLEEGDVVRWTLTQFSCS